MIRILLIGIFVVYCSSEVNCQDEISWESNYDQESNEIILKAKLSDGWHIYSQNIDEDAGPIPTTIEFSPNELVVLGKKIAEPEGKTVFDKNFNSTITYFDKEVQFVNKVRKIKKNTSINGSVLFMICNDEGCLPPDVYEFEIEIKK